MASNKQCQYGFTLIELAVVIAIVGLVLGTTLPVLGVRHDARLYRHSRAALVDVKEALLGFAVSHRRLPCPDTDRDGRENRVEGAGCSEGLYGYLPWESLGIPPTDVWGHLFRYRVSAEFVYATQPGHPGSEHQLDLWDTGSIAISTRGDHPRRGRGGETKELVVLTGTAPTGAAAVILSHGANGRGGVDINGNQRPAPTLGTDEQENFDGDARFVLRQRTGGNLRCSDSDESLVFCEYDDVLIYLSTPQFIGKLVSAGQLP